MSRSVTITFDAVMSNVEQDIDICTSDTPEEFISKLESGEYYTTLDGHCIMNRACEMVGEITNAEVSGSFDNFAVKY